MQPSPEAVAVVLRKRPDPAVFIIALSIIIMALTVMALVTTQAAIPNF